MKLFAQRRDTTQQVPLLLLFYPMVTTAAYKVSRYLFCFHIISLYDVTNIMLIGSWVEESIRGSFCYFSDGDNQGYCSCTGPMLKRVQITRYVYIEDS